MLIVNAASDTEVNSFKYHVPYSTIFSNIVPYHHKVPYLRSAGAKTLPLAAAKRIPLSVKIYRLTEIVLFELVVFHFYFTERKV